MKHEEAKQLLHLCRPGEKEDQKDPALAKAFAMLEVDSDLKAWFNEQQALDTRISNSINSIEAPAELKNTILTGIRLQEAHSKKPESAQLSFTKTTPARSTQAKTWWRRPCSSGVAAIFVVTLAIFTLLDDSLFSTQEADANLPPVIQYLSKEIDSLKIWQFDKRGKSPQELQAFLASASMPSPKSIPNSLKAMRSLGCVTFEYAESTKLSMICFKDGQVYHLITADKATYPDSIPDEPKLYQCENKAYQLWVDEEQVNILTIHGSKEDIQGFI